MFAFSSPFPFPRPFHSSSSNLLRQQPSHPRTPSPSISIPLHAKHVQTPPPAAAKPATLNPGAVADQVAPSRMFSNLEPTAAGFLTRKPSSELGATALVAGTMIGAGVLALPTVTAPAGFLPSSAALLGVWVYMVVTGLLISEVSINTACSLGRPSGVSVLSLGELTLGRVGAIITTTSYTLLHYAILTAYTSQGGVMFSELISDVGTYLHISNGVHVSPVLAGGLFAGIIGGGMYALPARVVEGVNNVLVGGVLAMFLAVLFALGGHVEVGRLGEGMHWGSLFHGEILSVLFVSCVYHNVVSSVTMRLEGDRTKIRRVIIGGSLVPLVMFLIYNGAILGCGGVSAENAAVVAGFSLLAVATSFVGFVEGLTEVWTDVRVSSLGQTEDKVRESRYLNFLATLLPPVVFTAVSPDVFLKALDVAGVYGIAVLFGGLPAAMAWKSRNGTGTKGFGRMVGGGDFVLAVIAAIPVLLIGNKVWEGLHHVV